MYTKLLSTRLKKPQPRKKYIIREKLFGKLKVMDEYRLTIFKGGAGTGKTTLLTSYLQETGLPSGWISLDEKCNDLFVFWNYVIEAFSPVLGEEKEDYLEFFRGHAAAHNMDEVLVPLINLLEGVAGYFLILDDFHVIENEQLKESFEQFLENISQNVHVVLLSRKLPSLYLAQWEMKGELLLIDEEDFLLSEEESLLFLKDTLGLQYAEDTLKALAKHAEGWIGGLQLLASATAGKPEKEIQSLHINNNLIKQYFEKEIFESMNNLEQDFLVATAVCSYFDKKTCQMLLEDIDFESMLEEFQQKNLMIQCIDEEQGVYRYHHMLRDYLWEQFRKYPGREQEIIHRRAAQYFYSAGDYEESLVHFTAVGDYKNAMQCILEIPQDSEKLMLFHQIPSVEAIKNFDFAIQKFFNHYWHFEEKECLDLYHLAMEQKDTDERYTAFCGLNLLFDQQAFDFNGEEILPAEKIVQFSERPATLAFIFTQNAVFQMNQNQLNEALDSVKRSMEYAQFSENHFVDYFNITLKTQVCEELGLLHQALDTQRAVYELFEKNSIMKQFHAGTFYVTVTGIYLKQMNLEEAHTMLSRCEDEVRQRGGQLEASYDFNLCKYCFLSEQDDKAIDILNRLRHLKMYINPLMLALLFKYWLRSGKMGEDLQDRFLQDYDRQGTHNKNFDCDLLYVRILYRKGEKQRALFLADEMLAFARKQEIRLKIVETSLFQLSVLIHESKDIRKLTSLYQEAIYYACDNDVKMPFFFEKDTVAKLYQQYGERLETVITGQERKFHDEIRKMCISQENSVLSEREMEVFRAMADGMTNKQIAEALCISLSTVKTHVIHIYQKFDVNTRVSAIERGRKDGIL